MRSGRQVRTSLRVRALIAAAGALVLVFAAACGGDGEGAGSEAFQKITPSDRVYAQDDFTAVGFRVLKDYNVEGLDHAVAAWYGFWQPAGEDPLDFEIRAYASHEDAFQYGTALAKEGTGPDAVLTSNKATWAEGVRERRTTGGFGAGPGARSGHAPRYADFAIFGNLIMLCEGSDSEQSLGRCGALAAEIERGG